MIFTYSYTFNIYIKDYIISKIYDFDFKLLTYG